LESAGHALAWYECPYVYVHFKIPASEFAALHKLSKLRIQISDSLFGKAFTPSVPAGNPWA
jgi:hypothetical protein